MELAFKYRFEAAHRFTDAESKCATPHGHSWWITLKLKHDVSTIILDKNFATDFKDLKSGWKKFIDEELDHHFFLNAKDSLANHLKSTEPHLNIKLTPGDPTTEVLASLFYKKAESILKNQKHIEIDSILLEETPTNSVSVNKKDAEGLLKRLDINFKAWWD
jgi:6-pyruvoyltetrahydropterin/6-carboxytetrahydropterin synthase